MIHFIQRTSSTAVDTEACCFVSSYIIQRVSVLEIMLITLYPCSSTSYTSSVRVSAYTRAQSLTSSLIWRTWASTAQRITTLLISVSQATPLAQMNVRVCLSVFLLLLACPFCPQSLRWRQGSMGIWIQCCLRPSRVDCAPRRARRTPETKVTLPVPLNVTVWVIPAPLTWHHTYMSYRRHSLTSYNNEKAPQPQNTENTVRLY